MGATTLYSQGKFGLAETGSASVSGKNSVIAPTITYDKIGNKIVNNPFGQLSDYLVNAEKNLCLNGGHSYKNGICTRCGAIASGYTVVGQDAAPKVEQVNAVTSEQETVVPEDGIKDAVEGEGDPEEKLDPVEVLESKYNAASAQLERNRSSAQQRAAVSLAKLQKYLPQQLKAQGLSGLGVSQTAALRMMNNYNAQMGEIDRDYNDGASDLLANYSDGRVALENAAAQDALAKYQINEQNKANAEKKAYSLYSDTIDMIDMGYFKTSGELTAYIDAHREDLGDYADRLDVIAKSSGEYIDEVAKDEAVAKAAGTAVLTTVTINAGDKNTGIGDNFSLKDDEGNVYRVEFGEEITDNAIKNAASSFENGSVFKYDGVLYAKKNNTIYKIQQRPSAKGHYDALYKYVQ